MKFLDADTLARRLAPEAVMRALHEHLGSSALRAPLRHAHELRASETGRDSLLLMPAWQGERGLGVKLVTVMTGGRERMAIPSTRSISCSTGRAVRRSLASTAKY